MCISAYLYKKNTGRRNQETIKLGYLQREEGGRKRHTGGSDLLWVPLPVYFTFEGPLMVAYSRHKTESVLMGRETKMKIKSRLEKK